MRKLKHHQIQRFHPSQLYHRPRHPVVVVLDNLRSLYNVGSIFRTSDALLIEKVILTGITATPDHAGLQKTALGSQDSVPWAYAPEAVPVLEGLREAGYRIAVLEITDAPGRIEDLTEADFPLCLVVGNEVAGVDDALVDMADMAIELPQYGVKHSLNVSVAYGIAAYNIIARYRSLSGL
jgi:tRNA G18 (ribose-2'-O)-methylase SpoU